MDDRRRYTRVPVSWPVRLSNAEHSIVGRALDISPYGICVVTAPTADVRLGNSYRVEAVADAGAQVRFLGDVRYLGSDRIGIEAREFLPLE